MQNPTNPIDAVRLTNAALNMEPPLHLPTVSTKMRQTHLHLAQFNKSAYMMRLFSFQLHFSIYSFDCYLDKNLKILVKKIVGRKLSLC